MLHDDAHCDLFYGRVGPRTGSKDALAVAPCVGILGSDLGFAGGVGQREQKRRLDVLADLLDVLLSAGQRI